MKLTEGKSKGNALETDFIDLVLYGSAQSLLAVPGWS
jgi:hypothetical protein